MTEWAFYDMASCPVCDQGPYRNEPTPLCGKPSFWQTCCLGCGYRGGKGETRAEAVGLWNRQIAPIYNFSVRETFVMVDEPGYEFDLQGYKVFANKYGFEWRKKGKRPYTVHGLTWRKWPPWFKRWERALPGIDE